MPLRVPKDIPASSIAAIWSYINRLVTNPQATELALLDATISSREAEADALTRYNDILLAIGAIPVTPELEADALARYNALVLAIGAIPTTPELEADALTRYNDILLAIGAIPTTPELEADALARYNALVLAIGAIPITPELEADALARYNALPADVWAAATRELTTAPELELTKGSGASGLQTFTIADVNAHTLVGLAPDITIQLNPIQAPLTGGALIEGTLLVLLMAKNTGGALQDITVDIYFKKAGGAWRVITPAPSDICGLPAVENAFAVFPFVDDVQSDLVVGGDGNYDIRVDVQNSDAGEVVFFVRAVMTYGSIGWD
ncbi:hypothetical protein MUP59_01990 [Candidatus Bathyarchaeota archaeon]|nr:hypothetical protein [Candidatus Bathyarchaeota archaeon]